MSVVCEQPTIAEKLVPYVEGALAEPDRSEVLEHLRSCEACAAEVRLLKSSIVSLRQVFSRTAQYRPRTHVSVEDLERFAFEPETLTAEVMRSVKLHLAECGECEQEVAMLREMEQELAEKVEPVRAPDALPAALREAVARQFGSVKTVQAAPEARRPWMESFLAFLASLSPKPLLAAGGAMVVLFVGMQFVQNLPAGAPQATVATTSTATASRHSAENKQEVAATPAAAFGTSDVALLPGKVDSSELPALSRKLWEARVSHSYRDGQIFVEPEDVDKARQALEIVPREVAAVDLDLEAKRKAQAAPKLADAKAASEAPAAEPVAEAAAAPASAPPPSLANAKVATYDETSRRERTTQASEPKPRTVAKTESQPAARPKAAPRPAPAEPPRVVAIAKKAPAPGTETVAMITPKGDKSGALANPRQQAQLPIQQQVAVAPNAAVLRGGGDDPLAPQLPVRSAAEEQSKAAPETADAGARPAAAKPAEPADREGYAAAPAPPAGEARREGKDQGLAARSNSQTAGAMPYSNVGSVGTTNAPATGMQGGAGGRAPANRMDDVAVADSALLTQARKVASEAVGESSVSIDKKDDGSVIVTVRSGRTLTSQEMDQLRKALRQKLSLADSDTVVIRQP